MSTVLFFSFEILNDENIFLKNYDIPSQKLWHSIKIMALLPFRKIIIPLHRIITSLLKNYDTLSQKLWYPGTKQKIEDICHNFFEKIS